MFYNVLLLVSVLCSVAQSCPTLFGSMDCSPPGSSAHGIFQARILEWVAISFSRESSQPRDQTRISNISCIGRQILYHWCHVGSPVQINHNYIYIPCLLSLPLLSQSHPSKSSQSARLGSLCYRATSHCVCFTHDSICMSATFSIHPTPTFPCCVHRSVHSLLRSLPFS